ncbi:hypothetical protein VPH35_085573 [Triticum aestivum]
MAQEILDLPSWLGALWVAHASTPLMAVVDGHEHEGGSGRRAGWLAGDSSLAVHGKVRCEAEGAPWRSVKGGKWLPESRYLDYLLCFRISRTMVISGHLGWVRSVSFDPGNKWFCPGFADRTITKRLRVGYGDANIVLGADRFKFRLMSMRIGSLLNHQNKFAPVATHGQWEKCDVHLIFGRTQVQPEAEVVDGTTRCNGDAEGVDGTARLSPLGRIKKERKEERFKGKKVVADASHRATWNVFAYFVFHFMLWWNGKELVKPVCTNGYELRKQFLLYLLKRRGNEAKENFPDIVKEFLKRII